MQPNINYLTLLILIILGVAIGNLTSSLIASKYINNKHEKETLEISDTSATNHIKHAETSESEKTVTPQEIIKLSPEDREDLEASENSIDHKQLIEQRKLDENGVRLAKRCNEWTIVHKDMNTQTSEKGMNKHCSEYYDYLSFGNLPDSN
ncbi:MAG: hypothetical protein ACRBDX_07430 [Gammaproteobacteria bacterium]